MDRIERIVRFLLCTVFALGIAGCGSTDPASTAEQAPSPTAVQEVPTQAELPVDLDVHTVAQLRGRPDVVIIDVREPYEYQESRIPGVILMPMNSVPQRLDEIPRDKTVVVMCRSGNRSSRVVQFLRQQGFTNVHNMAGGILAWSRAGYSTEP